MTFPAYDKHLQTPHLLTKDELAEQVRRYVATFHLNMVNSAKIVSTKYEQSTQQWTVKFETPAGLRTAVSKHLVQATGIGSQKPYMPPMADQDKYKGISIHSSQFKNGKELADKGAKASPTHPSSQHPPCISRRPPSRMATNPIPTHTRQP